MSIMHEEDSFIRGVVALDQGMNKMEEDMKHQARLREIQNAKEKSEYEEYRTDIRGGMLFSFDTKHSQGGGNEAGIVREHGKLRAMTVIRRDRSYAFGMNAYGSEISDAQFFSANKSGSISVEMKDEGQVECVKFFNHDGTDEARIERNAEGKLVLIEGDNL